MTYRAPVEDISFALKTVAGADALLADGRYGDVGEELVTAILEEAGRFASDEIAPLNAVGDRQGTPLSDGVVTMPEGFGDVYRAWCEGGWAGVGAPEIYGGQGLPLTLSMAVTELWNQASMAFGLGMVLTMGQIEALAEHASDEIKQRFIPKLASGDWTGTMNLTEPQAGSDLALLRSRAEPQEDGSYRIFGTKIYITYGEHDLTENIVHLVLARLPDAPAGTRGISLFVVPKFLINDDGSIGARNDVKCIGVEHKMGIHASPTCTMIYGDSGEGARGWLVGEENRGLACMFTMMNNARLAVGIQGVAIAERAMQQAEAYAHERRQGRKAGMGPDQAVAIAEHPDVKRNLMTMRALTEASRAICYRTALELDLAEIGADEEERRKAYETASLLTPLAKAFSTDIGVEVASIGVQVHGGMGYVEETGAA
ncbi:MAG: acyl-CoA dehydrogenase family protein, partial [Pseudomonadota bacterium]